MHVADKSHLALGYAAMRLSGYNSNPKELCFKIMNQTMAYLYHHSRIPIMYARKIEVEKPLTLFVNKGKAEIIPPKETENIQTKLPFPVSYSDANLGQDIALQRQSTTSTVHLYNGTIYDWICTKQNSTADCTNGSEVRALHLCVRFIGVF